MAYDIEHYKTYLTNVFSTESRVGKRSLLACSIALGVQELFDSIKFYYNIDNATGDQLDKLGKWIGVTRKVIVPIDDYFFEWEHPDLTWRVGIWRGVFDPLNGLTNLDDFSYRLYLKFKIGLNKWDGTVEGTYKIYNESIFKDSTMHLEIIDNFDMTVTYNFYEVTNPLLQNLILQGYLLAKPSGVTGIVNFL